MRILNVMNNHVIQTRTSCATVHSQSEMEQYECGAMYVNVYLYTYLPKRASNRMWRSHGKQLDFNCSYRAHILSFSHMHKATS